MMDRWIEFVMEKLFPRFLFGVVVPAMILLIVALAVLGISDILRGGCP